MRELTGLLSPAHLTILSAILLFCHSVLSIDEILDNNQEVQQFDSDDPPLITSYLQPVEGLPDQELFDDDDYEVESGNDLDDMLLQKRGDMWKFRSGKRAKMNDWKFRGGKRADLWKFRGGKRADLWKFRGGKRADLWKFRGGKRADLWKFRGGKRSDYGKRMWKLRGGK